MSDQTQGVVAVAQERHTGVQEPLPRKEWRWAFQTELGFGAVVSPVTLPPLHDHSGPAPPLPLPQQVRGC